MDATGISTYDMKTNTFTSSSISNIPEDGGKYACIASSQSQLFVAGGKAYGSWKADVYVYDLITSQWLSDIPSMQTDRGVHACVVHPTTDVLYAIGGQSADQNPIFSIETIETDNIDQKSWTYIEPLSQPVGWTRCVVHKDTIYILGGMYRASNNWFATDKVHTINVLTNEVAVLPDTMPLGLSEMASIFVGDIAYVFGGWNHNIDGKVTDKWMAYDTDTTSISTSEWIESDASLLPYPDSRMAVGIYNKSIYLLGGDVNERQLTEFLISDETFINHGAPLGSDVAGYAQTYTQINHTLYLKDMDSTGISTYDMKTNTFTSSYITNIPIDEGKYACIASSQTQLFVAGGAWVSDVFAYDLVASRWISNIQSMQTVRSDHACVVHPTTNTLYAIGGASANENTLSSIEIIEIENIQQKSWIYIEPLSLRVAWTRCAVHGDTIYVVGGCYRANNKWFATDKVHTINVLTNEVDLLTDTMPLGLSEMAPIFVGDILYVFGGWNHDIVGTEWNKWMMYDAFIPTSSPSKPPTSQSASPTGYPTTAVPTTVNAPDTSTARPITTTAVLPTGYPTSSQLITTTAGLPTGESIPTNAPITTTQTTEDAFTIEPTTTTDDHTTATSTVYLSMRTTALMSSVSTTFLTITSTQTDNSNSVVSRDTLGMYMIMIGSLIAVILCIGCLCVILQRLHKHKKVVEFIEHQEPNTGKINDSDAVGIQNGNNVMIQVQQVNDPRIYPIEREGCPSASLDGIGRTVEGSVDGEDVNNDADDHHMIFKRAKTDDGYGNNPNIADDEFVIDADGNHNDHPYESHATTSNTPH
eukprot:476001_1